MDVNTLTHIDVPEGQLENAIKRESRTRLKCGRLIGSKDSVLIKRKWITYEKLGTLEKFTNVKWSNDETQLDKSLVPEEAQIDQIPVSRTEEISMSHTGETRNHSDIIINNIFSFQMAMDIMRKDEDQEPQIVDECWKKEWLAKMERNNPNRAKLVSKTRSTWTCSSNTWNINPVG